jgi:hypothetical protein
VATFVAYSCGSHSYVLGLITIFPQNTQQHSYSSLAPSSVRRGGEDSASPPAAPGPPRPSAPAPARPRTFAIGRPGFWLVPAIGRAKLCAAPAIGPASSCAPGIGQARICGPRESLHLDMYSYSCRHVGREKLRKIVAGTVPTKFSSYVSHP